MKKYFIHITLYLLATTNLFAQSIESEAIEFVKNININKLDSNLTSVTFEKWLQKIAGNKLKIGWELNDCGEQTGVPSIDSLRDIPMCVGVSAFLINEQKIWITIIIGTYKKGILSNPGVYDACIEINGKFKNIKRLSDLTLTLNQSRKK